MSEISPETTAPKPSPADDQTVERLAACRGAVLFVGETDVGKTTLIGNVAREAIRQGVVTALVDSDIGQSNIGPPTTIGMSLFTTAPSYFRVRRPDGIAFVGSPQPFGFFLEMIAGVCEMVDQARRAGAELILIDTTGVAPGTGSMRLKEEKLMRVKADHLVLLERHRELHPLAQLGAACSFCTVHRAPVSPQAHPKPTSIRRGHRQRIFADYFEGARVRELGLAGLAVRGASLFAGRSLSPPARLRVAELMEAPILRAELTGQRLSVVCGRNPSPGGAGMLEQRFPRLEVRIYQPQILNGVLVGLEDGAGRLLDLGIVQSCDFTGRQLKLITPFTDLAAVRVVRFGAIRLRPDGMETGSLRPGEI